MPFAKVSYVAHVPGHHNSKGELAEWVVKSHETGKILTSYGSEEAAKKGLQNMHAHSGSLKTAVTTSVNALDPFTRAYIEAALWSSTDDDGTPLDSKYGVEDFAPDTLKAMIEDCKQFQQQNSSLFTDCRRSNEYTDDEMAGHDFWLTRNGHGAGFWDGDWPTTGEQLDKAAKKYGEAELYVGDDGYVYQTPGPVPPREEYNPTQEELADLKAMGIQGSKKTAIYIEEQWEDILQKKGYVVDESKDSDWNDTMYVNPQMPEISVMIHEGGGDESYYVVEFNGGLLEQGENPDTLWQTLDKAVKLYRDSIKHEREFNDADKEELKAMGVLGSKNPLLQKKKALLPTPKYDYEANGNDVVLISPQHATKLLEGNDARDFWVALDALEDEDITAEPRLQQLIQSFMSKQPHAATASYMIQVEASTFLNKKATASPVFISNVQYKDNRIEKFRFTTNLKKAKVFSRMAAVSVQRQLADFRMGGSLKLADESLEEVKEEDYGQEVIIDIHGVPPEFFNKNDVRKFTEALCDAIGMKRGPNYVWGDDNELGTMHNPKADGISCVQFLYSSSITMHAIDELQKVFINVFSCKTFDSEIVKKFVEEKIGGQIVSFHDFKRI